MTVSTNRRSLLKMSTALAASASAGSVQERIAHLGEFIRETDAVNATLPVSEWANPGGFAESVESLISGHFYELAGGIDVERWAAWQRSEVAMLRMLPFLNDKNTTSRAWSQFIEETLAWSFSMFTAGVRRGALLEHVRREVTPARVQCWDCMGYGVLYHSMTGELEEWVLCPTCAGEGTAIPPDARFTDWPRTQRAQRQQVVPE